MDARDLANMIVFCSQNKLVMDCVEDFLECKLEEYPLSKEWKEASVRIKLIRTCVDTATKLHKEGQPDEIFSPHFRKGVKLICQSVENINVLVAFHTVLQDLDPQQLVCIDAEEYELNDSKYLRLMNFAKHLNSFNQMFQNASAPPSLA